MPLRQITTNKLAALLAVGMLVMLMGLAWVEANQQRTERLVAPQSRVIRYEKWHPTREAYLPDEEVYFSVDREVFLQPGQAVGIRVTTAWQEVGGGMTYAADEVATLPHIIREPGRKIIATRRHLSPYMIPGRRYRLVGTVETVTATAAPSVELIESEPITVVSPDDALPEP